MRKIAVYGAGAYGEEVYLLIRKLNTIEKKWDFIGFFDDNYCIYNGKNYYGKVVGGMDELNKIEEDIDVALGVASPNAIKSILGRITKENITFPNIIDPETGYIDKESFHIGIGNVIGNGCRFSPKVTIGNYNVVVNDTIFGHDAIVGNYNVFFPETRLSGKVIVGDECIFGMRTAVFQGVKIADRVKLSAGSILSMNAREGNTYLGNPAKRLKL